MRGLLEVDTDPIYFILTFKLYDLAKEVQRTIIVFKIFASKRASNQII